MDDLTSVKELEADTPPLTAEARAAARTRLMTAIGRESRRGSLSLCPGGRFSVSRWPRRSPRQWREPCWWSRRTAGTSVPRG